MMLFLMMGLDGSSRSNCSDDMYKRIGEVIQFNVGTQTGEPFLMGNAHGYFELNATLRIKPLMIALPMYNGTSVGSESMTDWNTYKISMVRGYS